jgi:stage II sporulation protein D
MKRTLLVSAALFLAVFLIPLLTAGQDGAGIFSAGNILPQEITPVTVPPSQATSDKPSAEPKVSEPTVYSDDMIIPVIINGTVREMSLQEFIIGAVAAEMPALYPEEALKAQATAIRTLALYAQNGEYHENALLCDNFTCCLAYTELYGKSAEWGENFGAFSSKIINAVRDTDGVAVYYQGEPIEALFFAATNGRTRSAAEVWGGEKPYLQSVDSAHDLDFPGVNRGHGVGLSQYGARQLALDGYGYKEILKWYYTGVEVD